MKLLVDLSSVVGAYLHILDEEYGVDVEYQGQMFHIPDTQTSLERFQETVANLDIQPIDFIVVKDPGGLPKARTKILKSYKQKPRITPPEFHDARIALFDAVTEWLKSQGAIIATPKNFTEADDLLNQLAIRLPKTIIWTRDKDLLACPTDVLLSNKDGMEFNPEKFPVEKKFIHVYRTIVLGDKSDNVGACKGFGPAAWDKMIAQFGTDAIAELDTALKEMRLNELEDSAQDFKPFQLLIDQAEALYTIYQVLSFLPVPAHEIKWEGGMLAGTSTLVTAKNYADVVKKIKNTKYDYAVIDYEADTCQESKDWCQKAGIKVDVVGQEITGMGLRLNSDNYYFSVDHVDTDNIMLSQLEDVLELLWGTKIYAHNAGFEQTLTYNHFGTMLPNASCTQLMSAYVDEDDYHNLKHLSSKWLGYSQTSYANTVGDRSGMREVSGEDVVGYGIDDVITTDSLMRLFSVIMQYENTLDVFHKVEDDALYYTALCFIKGVDFDQEAYDELKSTNDRNIEESWGKLSDALLDLGWPGKDFRPLTGLNIGEMNRVHKAIHGFELLEFSAVKIATRMMEDRRLAEMIENREMAEINAYYQQHWKPVAEFNVRSPTQMGTLLYDLLKCQVRIRNTPTDNMRKAGKQGNPASNEAAIMNAIAYKDTPHVALLELLVEHKGYLTKESLFLEKWPKFVSWKDGKIHCSMRQSATTTRRFSHAAPNMAQLPKRKGSEFRNMMKSPGDDWFIWALDVDSQELCLQAWASQDENFLACYTGAVKEDVHSKTGFQVALKQGSDFGDIKNFESLLSAEAKPFRVLGKATNFATAYLCQAKKLSQMLCVTEKEAQDFMDAKDAAFPGLLPAVTNYIKLCENRGYAETFLGARRHLAGGRYFGAKGEYERGSAGRLAWSFRIQSSGAEQIKLSAGRMYREGLFDDGLCRPVTIVHDELVGVIHKDVLAERLPKLYACVCQPYADMAIQTSSTPEIGFNFGSLKTVKGPGFLKPAPVF